MINYVYVICGVIFAILGIFMIVNPKAATKAQGKELPEMIRKTKRSGIFVLICGIAIVIIGAVSIVMGI